MKRGCAFHPYACCTCTCVTWVLELAANHLGLPVEPHGQSVAWAVPPIMQEQGEGVLDLAINDFRGAVLGFHYQRTLQAISAVDAGVIVPEVTAGHLIDLEFVSET